MDGVSQPYKSNDVNSGNRLGRAPISKCGHFYRQLWPLFATVATFGGFVDYDYHKKKMMSKQAKFEHVFQKSLLLVANPTEKHYLK